MNQTNNPKALQSQRWILQALLDLMETVDYDKISVSVICHTAELDRRTFYRNFDSKNDVLEQYIKQLSTEYLAEFSRLSTVDQHSATLVFFRFWKSHLAFIRNMQTCGLSHYVFEQFRRFSETQESLFIGNQNASNQVNYMLAFRIGGFWNVMLTWAANHGDLSPEELTAVLIEG